MINAAKESLSAQRSEAESLRDRIAAGAAEMESLRAGTIARAEAEAGNVRLEIENLTTGRDGMDGRRSQLSDEMNTLRQKRASLLSESSAIKVSVAQLEELRSGLAGGRDKQLQYVAHGLRSAAGKF